jgi:hypothetical protein
MFSGGFFIGTLALIYICLQTEGLSFECFELVGKCGQGFSMNYLKKNYANIAQYFYF